MDRFQQCWLGERIVHLVPSNGGPPVATISFDYSLLAFAYDGSRRVDYVFSFDDFDTQGGVPLPETTLTVAFNGCGPTAGCSGTPAARTELVPAWKTAPNRTIQFTIASPDDTGSGTYTIYKSLVDMTMTVITALPGYRPWTEAGMAYSRARFDSANAALGQGKFKGTIFPDHVPTLQLDKNAAAGYQEEAIHVDHALHQPFLTFPSFVGKSVPGEGSRPLHRLQDAALRENNNNAARSICVDVWGPNYAKGSDDLRKECDEFPFASTYEGAYVSTGGNPSRWHGSARPILGSHNREGGIKLGAFYGENRILDENSGTPQEHTPSDPFTVSVITTP